MAFVTSASKKPLKKFDSILLEMPWPHMIAKEWQFADGLDGRGYFDLAAKDDSVLSSPMVTPPPRKSLTDTERMSQGIHFAWDFGDWNRFDEKPLRVSFTIFLGDERIHRDLKFKNGIRDVPRLMPGGTIMLVPVAPSREVIE